MAGVPVELKGRSFTRIAGWSRAELATLLDLADELKAERARRRELRVLPGRTLALIFHKPSTRTRVSSEVAIAELGGMALYVPAADLQLSRGESTRDTALVLSRMVSAILIRTFEQDEVEEFAAHASIPVINGLTDETHPLQALADAMTLRERFGDLRGCASRTSATATTSATPSCGSPRASAWDFVARRRPDTSRTQSSSQPPATMPERTAAASRPRDPHEAARGAHALYTDVWVSMGQDEDRVRRLRDLEPYRIDDALLALADTDAVAMHCLPAHVGEEIGAEVLYGARCLAWEQAENRLHTQKALMALVIR